MIYKQELKNLFVIKYFKSLKLSNIWINDCVIINFLQAISSEQQISNVEISDVYVTSSDLLAFISIQKGNIIFQNIHYYNVRFQSIHFHVFGELYQIKIINFYCYSIQLFNSTLIYLAQKGDLDKSNCTFEKIHITEVYLKNSKLFLIQNLEKLAILNSYLYDIFMENSTLMRYSQESLYFLMKDLVIINSSLNDSSVLFEISFLNAQKFGSIQIINLYIKEIKAYNSFYLFLIKTKQIFVFNLVLKHFYIRQHGLLNFEADEIFLKYLQISNFNIESEQCLIKFNSTDTLTIKKTYFQHQRINNTQLIFIEWYGQKIIRQIYLINFILVTYDQEQLILINTLDDNSIFEQIYVSQFNISSKTVFSLFKMRNEGKISVSNLYIQKLINQNPQIEIFLFDNQVFVLKMIFIQIHHLSSVQFLISKSRSLNIETCNISKIFMDENKLSSFIRHNSSIYQRDSIKISDVNARQFSGGFLYISSQNKIMVVLNNIKFNSYYKYYEAFEMQSFSFQTSILLMNNLRVINGFQNIVMQQIALIDSNFNQILIDGIYLKNISFNLLNFDLYSEIQITNLYIDQMISQNSLLKVNSEARFSKLILLNFTITNSVFQKSPIIELIVKDIVLIIYNMKMINLIIDEEVFQLEDQLNNQNAQFCNIIIINVVSHSFLFVNSDINLQSIYIIGGQSPYIFGGKTKNRINFKQGLITNIQQLCILSEKQFITIQQSEIVDSNIIQRENQLQLYNSYFLIKFNTNNQLVMIYLSLNNGKTLFSYKLIEQNFYSVYFTKNNMYLYLPSGRNLEDYKYFNYATGLYNKLYDSISFVSLYQSQELQCILRYNYDNETLNHKDIFIYPGVNIINNLIFTLNPLFKEKHIELDLICNQNTELITYRVYIKPLNCQLGEFLYKNQCQLCNIDQLLYSVGYNQQYCLHIDINSMEQLEIGQIKLFKQYWRYSYANKYIEYCKTENCLGGWRTGNDSCKIGYIGALCSECDVYNIRGNGSFGKNNNQCSNCYYDILIYLRGFILIIFQALLIYLSYYQNQQLSEQYLLLKISKKNFIDILLRQSINQVTILIKLYYNYLFTLYLLKDFNNSYGQFIDFSLDVVYNPSFIAIAQFDCLTKQLVQYPIQYTQLLLKILMPILLINIIVIIYIILIKFRYAKYTINVILLCLIVTNQQNQQVILQSLIKLSSKVKYSNIYWTLENQNVQFFSQNHQYHLFSLIIPLIILFVIINFVIFLWIRIVNQRIFNNLKLSIFIYRQYKHQFYFWEYFRLIYIYLFMLILYIYDGDYLIYLSVLLNIITFMHKPFNLRNCNQIDQIIWFFSLNSYFSLLTYQNNYRINKFIIFVISNLILLKIYIKYLYHSLNIQYRQQKHQQLSKLIKYMPYFNKYINLESYDKNKYFFGVLKQGRKKSNTSITAIAKSAESKYNMVMSFEVEMSQIQLKQ